MPINYPGTNQPVTKSFGDRILQAEFDDALLEQSGWKNSRYDGARLTAKKINKFSDGDTSYQNLPVITNRTTALYIANTVVGGEENDLYATIKEHSYVNINKILLIRPEDQSVQIIDRSVEPWDEFHRFITNDFPAGAKARVKIIDESISTNLQQDYRVKMNKGWLLRNFKYENAGEFSGSSLFKSQCLVENNSLYLYSGGNFEENAYYTGSSGDPIGAGTENWGTATAQNNQLRFRYGVIEGFFDNSDGSILFATESWGGTNQFSCERIGPSYASSSIHKNKFSVQYYSGSFGTLKHQTPSIVPPNPLSNPSFPGKIQTFQVLNSTAFASASRFIGVDSLKFLFDHNFSASEEKDKTELHLTLFQGTKDFAPGFHDERSISTFEIDENRAGLGLDIGDHCNGYLPSNHEFMLKGPNDGRFIPTIHTYEDSWNTLIPTYTGSLGAAPGYAIPSDDVTGNFGCEEPGYLKDVIDGAGLQLGINQDKVTNANVYVQGGVLGEVGVEGSFTGSDSSYTNSLIDKLEVDNFYSGSLSYEISWLDKDHTLIMNIDKDLELPNGIGDKGIVIIPEHSIPPVSFNVGYYLEKAGIIDSTSNITQNIAPDTETD